MLNDIKEYVKEWYSPDISVVKVQGALYVYDTIGRRVIRLIPKEAVEEMEKMYAAPVWDKERGCFNWQAEFDSWVNGG